MKYSFPISLLFTLLISQTFHPICASVAPLMGEHEYYMAQVQESINTAYMSCGKNLTPGKAQKIIKDYMNTWVDEELDAKKVTAVKHQIIDPQSVYATGTPPFDIVQQIGKQSPFARNQLYYNLAYLVFPKVNVNDFTNAVIQSFYKTSNDKRKRQLKSFLRKKLPKNEKNYLNQEIQQFLNVYFGIQITDKNKITDIDIIKFYRQLILFRASNRLNNDPWDCVIQKLVDNHIPHYMRQTRALGQEQIQQFGAPRQKEFFIPVDILKLESLEELNLSFNNWISFHQIQPPNLIQLNISSNPLLHLPSEVTELSQLRELDISHCGLKDLPKSLANLTSLEDLNVADNDFDSIPDEIGSLTNLRTLYLGRIDEKKSRFPESFRNLTQLHTLEVNKWLLTGSIPEWSSELASLSTNSKHQLAMHFDSDLESSSSVDDTLEYTYGTLSDLANTLRALVWISGPIPDLNLSGQSSSDSRVAIHNPLKSTI